MGGLGLSFDLMASPKDLLTIPTTITQPTGSKPAVQDLAREISRGADLYFGTITAVNNAKYASALARANAASEVAKARAKGQSTAEAYAQGYPSPALLTVAGVGLLALFLLRS